MSFKLRKYQDECKKDIEDFIHNSSHKKGILVSPVGCHEKDYMVHDSQGHLIKVQDVEVGDELMGVSSVRKVLKNF